ncbi:MAG TPA: energy-coupled thiamine transporter ThiT [Candidatus Eubacterium faecigallinarum]|nr:energy-coupled thiamine transporter ThiT [Candidatus Eubacterium faecigallinarum]
MPETKSSINMTRRLTETAIMIALAVALSYVQIFSLPMGGSVTLFSQVPIIIIGYRYGWKWGCVTGVIYGLLEMLLQGLGNFSYVKGIGAYLILIFADYVVAFMVLGLGGGLFKKVVSNQSVALGLGALVASALRFLCHFISGVTIWGEYADGWKSVWVYSLGYNGSYMAAEAAISVIGVVLLSLVLDFNKTDLKKKKKAN